MKGIIACTLHISRDDLQEWKQRIERAGILRPAYFWRFLRERRVFPRHVAALFWMVFGYHTFMGK